MKSAAAVLVVAAALACPASAPAQRASPALNPLPAAGTVQVAFTPWDDAEGMVVAAINEAQRQILVQAFLFTSRRVATALIAARGRGIEVLVTADGEQTRGRKGNRVRELAAAGIPVWLETRYASAHNKVMVIDAGTRDATVITGSYNWTSSAQRQNAENVMIVRRNRAIADAYAANWQRHRADAEPYTRARR